MSDPVPARWRLAPRRERDLAWWHPLHYLLLLYWVLCFPQAVPWHHERYPSRRLGVQLLVLYLALSIAFVAYLVTTNVVFWAQGLLVMGFVGMLVIINAFSPRQESPVSVVLFHCSLVLVILALLSLLVLPPDPRDQFLLAVGVGSLLGVALSAGASAFAPAPTHLIPMWFGCQIVGLLICWKSTEDPGWPDASAASIALVGSVCMLLFTLRLPSWVLITLGLGGPRIRAFDRCVVIPIPGVQRQLEDLLAHDWRAGVEAAAQTLRYSRQFVPAVRAVSRTLRDVPDDDAVERVATLADALRDADVLRYCRSDGDTHLARQVLRKCLFFLPTPVRDRVFGEDPKHGTFSAGDAVLVAFEGWWTIDRILTADDDEEEENNPELLDAASELIEETAHFFGQLTELRHGPELAAITRSLALGHDTDRVDTIAAWHEASAWLEELPEERLRPAACAALASLRRAAGQVLNAQTARAPLNRERALDGAAIELQELVRTGAEPCPRPERAMVQAIAREWLHAVERAGGQASRERARAQVFNPYEGYSGLPVSGTCFVGRAGAMEDIERLFHRDEAPPVIALYGHRRMGKTSILRNLEHTMPESTVVVYLDMQSAALVDDTGQFLLELAEAIHERISVTSARLEPGPAPDEADGQSTGRARRALDKLLEHIAPQMSRRRLIVAIDEFEIIESSIDKGRIDADVLQYLRAINQRYPWLALIFGGLHTLEEMNGAYWSVFYSQAETIPVSYLSEADARRLIERPHPDFSLTYEPTLVDELYRLTHGQPYLLQRLCWELVEAWNQRFAEREDAPDQDAERVLRLADLPPILDNEMFLAAAYYFEGVWTHSSDAEQRLLERIAQREAPWSSDELLDVCAELGIAESAADVSEILDQASRRDVLLLEQGGTWIRFASELMRRWIIRHTTAS